MSIKSKVLVAAATVTMVTGVGAAGVLATATTANAITPSCGATCVDIFSRQFGHHFATNFLLDVWRQHITIGQPIILYRTSNNDIAEDFRLEFQGTVADFFAVGMVSAALALHYGCIAGVDFPDCFGLQVTVNDPAFEIEYTPLGQFSGLCVGVANTASQREGVTLQVCGASSKTVWVVDIFDQPFTFFTGYAPLINGSDTNFSQPFVLTYPQSGFPTDKPRPVLEVDNLQGFSHGFPPILNFPSLVDNQLWGADFGPFTHG
jgi:hypothetical protein